MIYNFSVGQLIIKQGATVIKTIDNAKDITVDYSITTQTIYDSNGVPTEENKESEQLTISANWADLGFDISLAQGDYYDVTLAPGFNSSGIATITFARCKITRYSVRSSQGDFVINEIGFTKTGALDAAPGEEPVVQKIKFGTVYLGDSATLTTGYEGNVNSLVIPTALGVLLRSTNNMGGGQVTITVSGKVKKTTRLELEQYLLNLYISLPTTENTLTVEYGATTYSINNCFLTRGSPISTDKNYGDFTLEFLKSAF